MARTEVVWVRLLPAERELLEQMVIADHRSHNSEWLREMIRRLAQERGLEWPTSGAEEGAE